MIRLTSTDDIPAALDSLPKGEGEGEGEGEHEGEHRIVTRFYLNQVLCSFVEEGLIAPTWDLRKEWDCPAEEMRVMTAGSEFVFEVPLE